MTHSHPLRSGILTIHYDSKFKTEAEVYGKIDIDEIANGKLGLPDAWIKIEDLEKDNIYAFCKDNMIAIVSGYIVPQQVDKALYLLDEMTKTTVKATRSKSMRGDWYLYNKDKEEHEGMNAGRELYYSRVTWTGQASEVIIASMYCPYEESESEDYIDEFLQAFAICK